MKDIDSEYEKLGYSQKNYMNKENDLNSIYDKRISFDLNSNNKERKEETIILFDLESLKFFIYKGNDFSFIDEKAKDANKNFFDKNINKKNSLNERILNNDEILMILSHSLFEDNHNNNNNNNINRKQTRETFDFLYDTQNNSIKIDDSFFNKNLINLGNKAGQINPENCNKNTNKANIANQNLKNISKFIDNKTSTNDSIYSKADGEAINKSINENFSFNLIEKFYFCKGEAKKNRINSINNQNEKHNLNYLEFEKKQLRKKQNQRDYNNHICINLEFLKTRFEFFRNNEKISINIFINKFDIEDYVKNSKYKKIISKYVLENFDNMEIYENSKNSKKITKYKYKEDRPLLDFDIDIIKINESFLFAPVNKDSCEASQPESNRKIRKDSDYKIEENVIIVINKDDNVDNIDIFDLKNKNKKLENDLIHIDGYISPINILLDQATLVFIIEFFLTKDTNINNRNDFASVNNHIKGNNLKRNFDYKKIKDPLDIKLNVEKLQRVDKDINNKQKIKLKESMDQGKFYLYFLIFLKELK
jgi:hypothetical protein